MSAWENKENTVDLTGLKNLAQRYLKSDSPLKTLIMSEPDTLPKYEAVIKIQIFIRLLQNELRS